MQGCSTQECPNKRRLTFPKKNGIFVGGGQLGRIMVQAVVWLGVEMITLGKEHSPALQVSNPISIDSKHALDFKHQIGSFNSVEDIEKLSKLVEIITIKIKHVNVDILKTLLKNHQLGRSKKNPNKIYPHPDVIEIIQDKYRQNIFDAKIEEQVQQVAGRLGFPLMLKSSLFAYDGWGNFLIKTAQEIPRAIRALTLPLFDSKPDLSDLKLYAERFFPFTCKISVMVVKGVPMPGSSDPKICIYPPVQTIHPDNIFHIGHSPLLLGGSSASKSALDVAQ
ncbi:hypothetical protein VP01_4706g2 [Puccinia sorghi]|uniref:Uncharacterized protein n=1 Tax=Puccinia sorghi TaxID=27349 RepID=A0A0L6UN16_9BASI|nr:hypothetical protein VP01_4706g2 [Puccinia sorghi]